MSRVQSRLAISVIAALVALGAVPPGLDVLNLPPTAAEHARAWRTVAWAAPTADAGSTLVVIDAPRGGTAGTTLEVRGWAADPAARGGTGVDRVEIYLDGERDAGGARLGQATYGLQRPDIAAHLGSQQFLLSGYALQTTVSPGPHTIYVYAHPSDQPRDQGWTEPKQAAVIAMPSAGPSTSASSGPQYATPGAVTWRLPNVSGSVTLDYPGLGSNYPPGPADTGGPIYAPPYFGYGLYGGVPPLADYALGYGAAIVPPNFDFSLGYGYDLTPLGYLATPRYPFASYPRRHFRYGPVYCPAFTAVIC
jgi:hypothetical protein